MTKFYAQLLKIVHPDISKHPDAHARTIKINRYKLDEKKLLELAQKWRLPGFETTILRIGDYVAITFFKRGKWQLHEGWIVKQDLRKSGAKRYVIVNLVEHKIVFFESKDQKNMEFIRTSTIHEFRDACMFAIKHCAIRPESVTAADFLAVGLRKNYKFFYRDYIYAQWKGKEYQVTKTSHKFVFLYDKTKMDVVGIYPQQLDKPVWRK